MHNSNVQHKSPSGNAGDSRASLLDIKHDLYIPELAQWLSVPSSGTYQTLFNVAKVYPDKVLLFKYKTPITVQEKGWQITKKTPVFGSGIPDKKLIDSAIRRAKTKITDVILCNDFQWFITFTFNKDRQDLKKCKKKLTAWLNSQQAKWGKFHYLLVPEFHKDGVSVHFHGLFQGYNGLLSKTHIQQNGRTVYNIKSYQGGFTTAVKIDNKNKVANYVKKYLTKDMPHIAGKKRYWTSQGIKRPQKFLNVSISQEQALPKPIHSFDNLTIYDISDIILTY
ncbi:MAG: hypothetical protein WCJ60_04425 [bacterium]